MQLLSGSEQPDEGRVVRRVRVSWPLGFSGGFNGSMTGTENIRFLARIYGAVTDYARDFSELGESQLPIKSYSSGMRARLAFGMSLATDFDCCLIDEITAGRCEFQEKVAGSIPRKTSGFSHHHDLALDESDPRILRLRAADDS